MAAGRTLTVYLTADTRKAAAEIGAFGKATNALAATAKAAALGGIAVAGAALVKFGADAITAAEESRQADRRLRQVATSMGVLKREGNAAMVAMDSYASSVSRATATDDEQVKAVQAKLLTFQALSTSVTEQTGAFNRATAAAIDLAANGFGTMESNAVMLGKALQDPERGLSAMTRTGTLTSAQVKAIGEEFARTGDLAAAQAAILAAVEKQVGGVGAATATAGEKMALAYDTVAESIGEALLPLVDDLAGWVQTVTDKFAVWWQEHGKKVRQNVKDIAAAIGELLDGEGGDFEGWLDRIAGALDTVAGAAGPVVDLWKKLTGWVESADEALSDFLPSIKAVTDPFTYLMGTLEAGVIMFRNIAEWVGKAASAVWDFIRALGSVPSGPISFPSIPGITRAAVPAVAGVSTRSGLAPAPRVSTRAAAGVVVNITTGVGDPVAIAREVERVLGARRVRLGVA